MKVSNALFISAASAAAVPNYLQDTLKETLEDVKEFLEGLPLGHFGQVHSISIEDAINRVDLIGTNFSSLPISSLADSPLFKITSFKGAGGSKGGNKDDAEKATASEDGEEDQTFDTASTDSTGSTQDTTQSPENLESNQSAANSSSESAASPSSFSDTEGTEGTQQSAVAGTCSSPNVRFEWDDFAASDKKAFVDAIQCLIESPASGRFSPARNRFEDFVRLHQSYSPKIHSKSTTQQTHKFILWHRYYVWAFEQVLRDECGFDRAFPWWDEKKWAGKFAQSTIFTPEYFGSLPTAVNGNAICINDGRFAGLQLFIGPGMTVDYQHCLQRAVDEQVTSQTGMDSWNACMARTTYPDFHSCVEFTFHGQGHNGVGGIMADAIASPGDPSFFMHHLFVDYAFRKWQLDDASRMTTISGCEDADTCQPLTLDSVVYLGNICGDKCPDLPVRDIIDTTNGHFCYRYNY